jgi:hypothetical protein
MNERKQDDFYIRNMNEGVSSSIANQFLTIWPNALTLIKEMANIYLCAGIIVKIQVISPKDYISNTCQSCTQLRTTPFQKMLIFMNPSTFSFTQCFISNMKKYLKI